MTGASRSFVAALLVAGVVLVSVALATVLIVETVQTHALDRVGEGLTKTERVYPRRIPVCDKPMWDRIREGCHVPKNGGEDG